MLNWNLDKNFSGLFFELIFPDPIKPSIYKPFYIRILCIVDHFAQACVHWLSLGKHNAQYFDAKLPGKKEILFSHVLMTSRATFPSFLVRNASKSLSSLMIAHYYSEKYQMELQALFFSQSEVKKVR